MISFRFLHPKATEEHLGLIPMFFVENDPRPAAAQIEERYAHGGGWSPLRGFKLNEDGSIKYPGDPLMRPIAEATLHLGTDKPELIRIYESGFVCIRQADGSFEIDRLD